MAGVKEPKLTADTPPAFFDGRQAPLVSKVNAALNIIRYALITLACLPVQLLLRWLAPRRVWEPFVCWYHACILAALGVQLVVLGTQVRTRPTLFVANHNSYLDIEVLGAFIPGSFVAMEQVGTWPLFGLLSRLQETVFIDRRTKSIAQQQAQLTQRFDAKQNLIIFPEGSSYTGTHLMPFRSSLLAVAKHEVEGQPILIQPVSVTFARLDGLPISRGMRTFYSWYGQTPLAPHMLGTAGLGRLQVVVEWHPPKTLANFDGSRKHLTAYCETAIKAGMARARTR